MVLLPCLYKFLVQIEADEEFEVGEKLDVEKHEIEEIVELEVEEIAELGVEEIAELEDCPYFVVVEKIEKNLDFVDLIPLNYKTVEMP